MRKRWVFSHRRWFSYLGGVPPPNAKCAKKVEKRPFSRPPPGTPKKGSGGGPCPRSPFKLVKSSKFDVSLIRGGTPPYVQCIIKSLKPTPPPLPHPPPPPTTRFLSTYYHHNFTTTHIMMLPTISPPNIY